MTGDDIEAIGQVAEGAIAARAVESGHGESGDIPLHKGHFHENECLNCGTPVTAAYCQNCGQKAHLHRSLAAFGHDLMHGVLHLDGKLWRTLPLLIFKPGEITRRYVNGERAKFVSPMAMFLFSVFAMFAVFQIIGLTTPTTLGPPERMEANLDQALVDAEKERDAAKAALAAIAADDPARADAETTLSAAEETVKGVETAATIMTRGQNEEMTFDGTGIGWIDDGLIKKWRDNPGLMLYKLQANSYKFSWLLIPLSLPFVWLLFFWKRRFKAYDHTIFVTYSLAFMSLLFIVLSVLAKLGASSAMIALGAISVPPVHIYKQLRESYELSRFGAFWRTAALVNLIVFVVLMIFLWLLLLLGAV